MKEKNIWSVPIFKDKCLWYKNERQLTYFYVTTLDNSDLFVGKILCIVFERNILWKLLSYRNIKIRCKACTFVYICFFQSMWTGFWLLFAKCVFCNFAISILSLDHFRKQSDLWSRFFGIWLVLIICRIVRCQFYPTLSCVSSHLDGAGGTPFPGPGGRGRGSPIQLTGGYPIQLTEGTPFPSLVRGVPPSSWQGVPPPPPRAA